MRKADRRQAAFSIAQEVVGKCDAATRDALCIRMTMMAIAARMSKRPIEEQTARKVLALAERRLAELRAVERAALTSTVREIVADV